MNKKLIEERFKKLRIEEGVGMDGDLYFLLYKLWSVFVELMLPDVAWSYCLTSDITGRHGCTPADMLFAHTIKRVLENTTKLCFVCTLLDE